MNPEKWAWSCGLFERALELDAADRADFLVRASARDPEVLHLVLRMLEADDTRPNTLDRLEENLARVRSSGSDPGGASRVEDRRGPSGRDGRCRDGR